MWKYVFYDSGCKTHSKHEKQKVIQIYALYYRETSEYLMDRTIRGNKSRTSKARKLNSS